MSAPQTTPSSPIARRSASWRPSRIAGAAKITTVEGQSSGYAGAELKWVKSAEKPFVYEATGILTRFTDGRDPKPRSREVFTFHRPETLREWFGRPSFRAGLIRISSI